MKKSVFSVLLAAIIIAGCQPKSTQPVLQVGEFKLSVPGSAIWYKVTGEGNGIPVVLIHGGPGGSSGYLKPFEELGNDRQVIRYDQSGCGKSDPLTDTTLFTVDYFVKELDSLRSYLKIPVWHVFGHSWGTIIAIEYYHRYPGRIASLTFGSLCFDLPAWFKSTNQLLLNLPDSLVKGVRKAEEKGNYNDPLYQEALNQFYGTYAWGRNPPKEEMDSLMSTFNTTMYGFMWGPSEFTGTGTLKGYDASYILSEIKVPTLFTAGEFDEILPEIVKEKAAMVKGSQTVIFEGSTHMTPWDARDENVRVVREFLLNAEK